MKKATAVIKAPVSEIFFLHQGEGVFVGEPQVFVRFVGCNLRCDYCDTADNQVITEHQKYYSVDDILGRVKKLSGGKPCTVSLTGGEPLLYAGFLARLLPALKKLKYKTYLETNGTLPELYREVARWVDVVSMDMKVASACRASYWAEHRAFLSAAGKKAFVKLVITAATTPDARGIPGHTACPADRVDRKKMRGSRARKNIPAHPGRPQETPPHLRLSPDAYDLGRALNLPHFFLIVVLRPHEYRQIRVSNTPCRSEIRCHCERM